MTRHLKDKVAIVTGAGKGIGLAISKMLAEEGCKLMLNARTQQDLEQLKQEILNDAGPHAHVELFAASVADASAMEMMIEKTVKCFGRIDILINNAGTATPFVLLQELRVEEIDDTIDTNLKGPLYTMKFTIPHMVHHGSGTIININSIAGKTAYPYSAVYCASKFGLTALTECVAGEQRMNDIKIVGIYPGEVLTPLWNKIEPHPQQDPERMLDPTDIAEAVRYVLRQPQKSFVKDITIVPQHPPA